MKRQGRFGPGQSSPEPSWPELPAVVVAAGIVPPWPDELPS